MTSYDDRHKARPTSSRQPTRADVAAAQNDAGYEEEDEYEYGDEVYPPRQPTSSRRYQTSGPSAATSSGQFPVVTPHRTSSRAAPATTSRRLERDPLATRVLPRRRRVNAGGLVTLVGVAMLIMMLGWLALSALGSWWQVHQDDVTYGRPRTFQTDAVVGHNGDSAAHPSHFIALNLNRHVVVIEIPAADPSKALIYSGPLLMGDGQDLTPITLTFTDVNGDGKLDMQVHLLDQVLVYLNTGSKFAPPPQQ